MDERYICLEVRVACGSCGQSIPVNGPWLELTCPSCFSEMKISADIISGFINDFEEEYQGLERGQGQGGTVMSGSGTYRYGYWRLPPRCSSCKKPLHVPENAESDMLTCECGCNYYLFPAPAWLEKASPSAVWCLTPEPPPGTDGGKHLKMDEGSSKPIVMSCPQCGGSLSVSGSSERVMECAYCQSEVYVPDEVWKRLHPVPVSKEWFACLRGKNIHQLRAERRKRDEEADREFLKGWKLRHPSGRSGLPVRSMLPLILILLAAAAVITVAGAFSKGGIAHAWTDSAPYLVVPLFILVPVWFAVRSAFSGRIGRGRESMKALAELAENHGWSHEGTGSGKYVGYIDARYRGRDIEIHPADEYAMEIDIDHSFLYLKTEPPGYPGEELQRFVSPDQQFNQLFPLRYALPDYALRIESSMEETREILGPVYAFLGKWEDKLARLKIDWSGAAVHIKPGHADIMDTGGRYVRREDLEPLLEDMMTMAEGLEAIARGRNSESST